MSKLKKVRTIRALSLSLYRDEVGERYYRWRGSNIKRVPRWFPGKRSMRWIMVIAVLVIAGSIAYPPVMRYASDKVIEKVADELFTKDELAELIEDPSIQKIMKQLEIGDVNVDVNIDVKETVIPSLDASAGAQKDDTSKAEPNSGSGSDMTVGDMSFTTNEETLKFLLKKFEMSELKSLADKATGGLTPKEKSEIKSIVTERLTPKEYESLKVIAVMEIQRRQGNMIVEH